MNNTRSPHNANCTDLMTAAERELAAFLDAVTELYGAEEAELAAEIWLDELQGMNRLPGREGRDWRKVTISALARLASSLAATELPAMPVPDCSASAFRCAGNGITLRTCSTKSF